MTIDLLDMNMVLELLSQFNYIPMIWPLVLYALIKLPIINQNNIDKVKLLFKTISNLEPIEN
jgi:hypothetical protein